MKKNIYVPISLNDILKNENAIYIAIASLAYLGLCKILSTDGKFNINADLINQKYSFSYQPD